MTDGAIGRPSPATGAGGCPLHTPTRAVAALLAALLVGCSGGGGGDARDATSTTAVFSPTTASATSPETDDPADPDPGGTAGDGVVVLPLDAYTLTADDASVIVAASNALVAACMDEQGFTYEPTDEAPVPVLRIGVHDDAYGVSEFDDAAVVGYRGEDVNAKVDLLMEGQEQGRLTEQYSPEYLRALTGTADPLGGDAGDVGDGGCLATAERRLRGGADVTPPDVTNIVGQLGFDAAARTRSDPAVLDGFAAWSACMAEAGFDFATPSEPGLSLPPVVVDGNDLQHVPPPSAEEVGLARVDQGCKRQVGLFAIWVAAETRHQEELIAQNETLLAEFSAFVRRRVRSGREVLDQVEPGG